MALDTYATLFTTQPSMSVTGIQPFAAYLAKKSDEGKHYNVALSHAAKKLVRLIFAMENPGIPYCSASEGNFLNSQQGSDKTSALLYLFELSDFHHHHSFLWFDF